MRVLERLRESLTALIRWIIRSLLCPAAGLWLVYRLGSGQFSTGAIPFIATLASTLIGLPVWLKTDERRRQNGNGDDPAGDESGPRRRRKRITIDFGGGDDEEGDSR